MALVTNDLDKVLEDNAVRLYRLITSFKNEYGYNTIQSSVRATALFLTEIMQDTVNVSLLEMKMLITKLSEIELSRRHLPFPKLVQDTMGNKFYDLRGTNLVARLPGSPVDIQLLELPTNTLTVLIVTVMNDARLRAIAFTDNKERLFVEVGDIFERHQ